LAKFLAEEKINFILLEEDNRFGIKPCGRYYPFFGKVLFLSLFDPHKAYRKNL